MSKKKKILLLVFGAVFIVCSFILSGDMVALASTGVEGLDTSLDNGTTLLEGVCRAFGGMVTMIGIVLGAIGFFGHQTDMKAQAPIWIGVGVVIFFAPEITDFLLGRKR